MKLIVSKGWFGKEELVSEATSWEEVTSVVQVLDWTDFSLVRLEIDSQNWLDISGNIAEDGLAIVFAEEGIHYISNDAPSGISEAEEVLKRYLDRDQRFKNFGFTSEFEEHPLESKTVSPEAYQKWKAEFEEFQRQDKRSKRIKKMILALITMLFIVGVFKLIEFSYSYEFQFMGHNTALVIGRVTEVEWMHFHGDYLQRVEYYISIDGKHYKGYFLGAHQNGAHEVGDQIQVKYAIDDPSISKIVGFVKEGK